MQVNIRKAMKADCPRLMELIRELAIYEKAPDDVTVTMEHFAESGFGKNPVWWAFVAEVDGISRRICTLLYPLFDMERTSHVS